MNPPRPAPRLVPIGEAAANRKVRNSFFGSTMRTLGSSRMTRSRSLVELRHEGVDAQAGGGVLELADQPVDVGGGPAVAGRVDVG